MKATMKKIIRFSSLILVALVALLVSSCTNEYEYTGAEAAAGDVYFSNSLASTIELTKSESSFDVTLSRTNTSGSLTVPLTFTASEGNIFTVPTTVTFADGENTTTITVTYNPNDLEYGVYTGGTIAIAEGSTPYGVSSYTFKAGATEWADIETNNSIGSYREDMIASLFSTDNVVYDVKIQKSVVNEGRYRMVNPYGEAFPYNEEGDYDADNDYYWVIDATDPDAVWFETFKSGMSWTDYGMFTFYSYVSYYMGNGYTLDALKSAHPEYFGTLKDGIITMPAQTMLTNMSDYGDGKGLYYGNSNGMLAVALPGYTIADYSVSAEYVGRFINAANEDYAQFSVSFGSDVASVKYVLVASSEDVDAVAQGVIDGTVEAETLSAAGTIQVGYGAGGKYTLVMVIYNADGEAVGTETLTVKLTSSNDVVETFNDVATGTLTIGAQDLSAMFSSSGAWGLCFGETMTGEAVLSQSTSNASHFRLTYIDESMPLDFMMDADGVITFEGVDVYTEEGLTLQATDLVTFFGGPTSSTGSQLTALGYNSHLEADGSYYFSLIYTSGENYYGIQSDTFVPSTANGAKALKAAVAKARKAAAGKHASREGGKHVLRQMIGNHKVVAHVK